MSTDLHTTPADVADAEREQRVAARLAHLLANDREFRAAAPSAEVQAAIEQPGLPLSRILATLMEGYADRPALGQRAHEIATDAQTGRRTRRLLPRFETITYRQTWARVQALASAWCHDPSAPLHAGDMVCVLGFAGIAYAVLDLACIHLGIVCVPLQTNAPLAQLVRILEETQPRLLATSMDCLDTAVDCALAAGRPTRLLVIDDAPDDDDHQDKLAAAMQRVAGHAPPVSLERLALIEQRGRSLPAAPAFVARPGEDPLATIFYTSGSTGSPKGAMYTERMFRAPWVRGSAVPLICLNYMPLNHSFGRSWLGRILASGGTCHFTARSDLSLLFEDLALVRPTALNLVPRICEMVFHQYQGLLAGQAGTQPPDPDLAARSMAELRQRLFGGRVLSSTIGAAPLAPELASFIERCLDVKLNNAYGSTEVSGVSFNSRIMRPPVIDYKLVDVPELGYFGTDKPYPRGELFVKTAAVMPGYYRNPQATAAVFDADGYYMTGDIMAQTGPDQIVYVDRRNNVLKLAQGEFVAIANVEATFASGHPAIRQIFIHGSSERAYLLAVIVPQAQALEALGEDAVKDLLREAIKQVAASAGLPACEVPRDFLVETEPFSIDNGLLTTVGKLRRPALKERYGARLEQLYADIAQGQADELRALRQDGAAAPPLDTIVRAVRATLGIPGALLKPEMSFQGLGGDSLSALSFSMLLEEIFGVDVPVGVVIAPTSSLRRLADHIQAARSGGSNRPSFATVHGRHPTAVHASELTLDKFIDARTLAGAPTLAPASAHVRTVLLTGANGFLGRFLCLEWLERLARVGGRLVCIARGHDAASARQRIASALDSGDEALRRRFEALAADHLEVLAGDIGEPDLGLDPVAWTRLAASVDLIVHPAALVNHVLPYQQLFGPNVVGTAELIRLAITTRLKPFDFVSTVAAATRGQDACVDEDADIRIASPRRELDTRYASGYGTSKWAGEVLLREAHDHCGLPVTVFRSDMILAHSRYVGQLNVPDMFTRLIFSIVASGLAPRSFYAAGLDGQRARAHYDGLPVDFTAEAIAALGSREGGGLRTYHVANPHDDGISLDDFVDWLIEAGHPIQRIDDHAAWLARFEAALRALPEGRRQHSSLALLQAFERPAPAEGGSRVPANRFHAAVRALGLGPDGDIPHLGPALVRKVVADLRRLDLV
jgi:fatty acid CoA ligase FadD9